MHAVRVHTWPRAERMSTIARCRRSPARRRFVSQARDRRLDAVGRRRDARPAAFSKRPTRLPDGSPTNRDLLATMVAD